MDETGASGREGSAAPWSADVLARHRLAELEATIQCIPDGVYVGDATGVRYCNQPALDMLGYRDVAELNRRIATLMDEVDARTLDGRKLAVEENVFVRALGGESATMDIVVRHRRLGEDRVLRSSAAPIRAGGAIIGAVAVNVDVTDERRASQELRTQRALLAFEREVLARLAEGAELDALVATLASGVEGLASPGLLASVLLVEDGVVRHVAAPSLPPAWVAAIEGAPIGPCAGSCGTAAYRGERVIVTDIASDPLWADYRDGALAHGLRACWSEPIRGSRGPVLGTVALYYREPRAPTAADLAVIDGTARVARIVLERHRDERARAEAERAREQAVAELRESLRLNELLTGVLGHDLRTPLAAMITLTEVALRLDDPRETRTALTGTVASGRRMARMIDQILDLTRARRSDGFPIRRAAIDLADVVRTVVAEAELAYHRPVEVALDGDTRGGFDGDRLWQVCSNLISNAFHHGDGSPVRLSVDGRAADTVVLAVSNGGVIPDVALPWLFDPFRRGPNAGPTSQGLGLGLYITRQIVLAHGGDITVTSTPAAGTTFRLTLPRTA